MVVEAEVFPNILKCLRDSDLYVRKNAATCIREIAKHTPEVRASELRFIHRAVVHAFVFCASCLAPPP